MSDFVKRIEGIMTANFPNGIRDDFIDTNKVLRIYSANYTDEMISRYRITNIIHDNGIEDGGRFYFISERIAENLKQFMTDILKKFSIVYYSVVHEKHADFFAHWHIFSPYILKKILQKVDGKHFYFDEFCSLKSSTRLDGEISKIFTATEKSLSLDDLQEKLPYVPQEKILAVLKDAKKYLSTKSGGFFPLYKIKFDLEEIRVAKQQIFSHIDVNGYAVPEDYSLSSNFALNHELTEKDLRNLIYKIFFAADFTKNRTKLFKKGNCLSGKMSLCRDKLWKFFSAHDELSADKIFAFAEKLEIISTVALEAAYQKMVRVAKNLFIKDSLIHFDIDGIDEALASFVQGKIISLRSVTSFTGFPTVESYPWNLFMLESFLYKYSRRYVYDNVTLNNSNLGAIYPRSKKFEDYLHVQAAVVAQEHVPLKKVAVENFLVEQGFRSNRIDKNTAKVIALAQEISHR